MQPLALVEYLPVSQARLKAHDVQHPLHRCVDAHNHLGRWLTADGGWMCPDVGAVVGLMDEIGVECIVNLDGRWGDDLEANLARYDRAHPGRFATYCHVDWAALARGESVETLVAGLRRSAEAGARGLKVWKNLGLGFEDAAGRLLLPDDPRLDPIWAAAGELDLPILIHVADPIAFFEPIDASNERYEELLAHPDWAFHDGRFPRFWRLMEALEAIVARHPSTTFVGVHAGCCAEDLGWVGGMLDRHPNFHIDIAARIAELGRQPRAARALICRHPDRVLFGTDGFPPRPAVYHVYFRFLETADEYFPYSPSPERVPPQGRWNIYGLDLPDDILRLVYRDNARRLLRL